MRNLTTNKLTMEIRGNEVLYTHEEMYEIFGQLIKQSAKELKKDLIKEKKRKANLIKQQEIKYV